MTKLRPFAEEGEQSKAVDFRLPGFENVTRRVNRPQLNLNAPSSVSIDLIKVSQETATRPEERSESKPSQSASPIPSTSFEQLYHAESSSNVTQLPSCFVSSATRDKQGMSLPETLSPSDEAAVHHYLADAKAALASDDVRLFSFSDSIKPYSHHAAFYNPSFTSPDRKSVV